MAIDVVGLNLYVFSDEFKPICVGYGLQNCPAVGRLSLVQSVDCTCFTA